MSPVTQDIFFDDPQGRAGNCLQALVASITEKPLEEVPHFAAIEDASWFDQTVEFLNKNGFNVYDCEIEEMLHVKNSFVWASGPSPRGVHHCVLYQNGEMIHDPHPSGAGLVNITWCAVLIPKIVTN